MNSNSKKILIVDDDKFVRDSMSLIIKNAGYTVESFENGIDAVKKILAGDCYAVISDYHMPGLGGMDIIKAIKKINADLPIIIVTGDSSSEVERKVGLLNIYDFFLKPINPEKLEETLASIADKEEINMDGRI